MQVNTLFELYIIANYLILGNLGKVKNCFMGQNEYEDI